MKRTEEKFYYHRVDKIEHMDFFGKNPVYQKILQIKGKQEKIFATHIRTHFPAL